MKKITVILLLFVYGYSTAGATIHLHYCMNEYVGWSLVADGKGTCGKCGMEEREKDGCCKDEHKHFQLKTEQQKTNMIQFPKQVYAPAILITAAIVVPALADGFTLKYPLCHAPPGARPSPLHLLNCSFLI